MGADPVYATVLEAGLGEATVDPSEPMLCFSSGGCAPWVAYCPSTFGWLAACRRRKASQHARTPAIAAAGIPTPSPTFAEEGSSEELSDDVEPEAVALVEGLELDEVVDTGELALVVAEALVVGHAVSVDVMLK